MLGSDSPNGRCGRIAGVRFDSDGKLLCADAVHGIWKVDVDTGNDYSLTMLTQLYCIQIFIFRII